jgi:hypothetical protein
MNMPHLLPTKTAALCLGVSAETLRGWRQRHLGPTYVRLPGGTICYPLEDLKSFIAKVTVQEGKLPRPHPGRMPGGRNKPKVKPAD